MFCGVLIIIATLTVYILSKAYQTLHGKCETFLIIGILAIYCSMIATNFNFYRIYEILIVFGCLGSFLWSNVLCFDIFWTFRNVEVAVDEREHFKFYCIYAFATVPIIFLIGFILGTIQNHFEIRIMRVFAFCVFTCFIITVLMDLLMLASTGVKIFKMSKAVNLHDHAWFETHKER